MSYFSPSKSLSHLLIIVCVAVSLLGFINNQFFSTFALYPFAFQANILHIISQGVVFQFLHGDLVHLAFNMYALWYCGIEVEARITRKRFITFFIFTTVVLILSILFLSDAPVVGISGFCMALFAYFAIDLYSTRHPAFTQVAFLLIFNIFIGLHANISFVGHLFGTIAGIVYWYAVTKKLIP